MGDHSNICTDRLITSENINPQRVSETAALSRGGSWPLPSASEPSTSEAKATEADESSIPEEEEPLIQMLECRICQEEDSVKNLEIPCACSGSLKYAHRKCVQRWCDEKGDLTCEICNQPYQPGYTAPPPRSDTVVDIGEDWSISSSPIDLNDPRLLAMSAERHFLDAEYDEYDDTNSNGAAFCRSAALILMALLLLRHALSLSSGSDEEDDDVSAVFSLFLLRAVGFLLPCYIMAWAISVVQRRRQRQEAAALAAAEVAFMIQARQHQGLHFTILPTSAQPGQSPDQVPEIQQSPQ